MKTPLTFEEYVLDIPQENDSLLTNFDSRQLPIYQEAIKRYDRQRGVRWWRPMKPLLRISEYAFYNRSTNMSHVRIVGMHSLHLCVGRSESPGMSDFWEIYRQVQLEVETRNPPII